MGAVAGQSFAEEVPWLAPHDCPAPVVRYARSTHLKAVVLCRLQFQSRHLHAHTTLLAAASAGQEKNGATGVKGSTRSGCGRHAWNVGAPHSGIVLVSSSSSKSLLHPCSVADVHTPQPCVAVTFSNVPSGCVSGPPRLRGAIDYSGRTDPTTARPGED